MCRVRKVENDLNWFDNRIRWKLGDGKSIKFWEDKWIGDLPLKHKFLRLHSLSLNVDSLMCEMGEWVINSNEGEIRWGLCWRRKLSVWEKKLEE